MTSVDLKVPADLGRAILEDIEGPREWAGYLLCGRAQTERGEVLLGIEWHPVPREYEIRDTRHGFSWHPDFDVEMLNRAQRGALSCVVIHHHGGSRPALSSTDLSTMESLMPFLSEEAPGRPHVFAVLGDHSIAGSAYRDGLPWADLDGLRVGGGSLVDWLSAASPRHAAEPGERHDRLIRGFGARAYAQLARATVGVVGCGGGGSHVVQQLAYLGIGTLVVIDPDRVEESNLSRLVGARSSSHSRTMLDRLLRRPTGDVGSWKVDVMSRLVAQIPGATELHAYPERFPTQSTVNALRSCDAIVACVDGLHVRDDLNRLAKRYLIPLLDVGVEIVPGKGSAAYVEAISGRVTKVLADGPCLRCQGLIDDAKLTAERGNRPPGYTGPVRAPDPAVVTLNGILASIAATEVLQLLTGFAGGKGPNCGWIYDGLSGTVERSEKPYRGCLACIGERGQGDA